MKFKQYYKQFACSLAIFATLSSAAYAATLTDIGSHWGKDVITELTEKKVINGYPDGTFKPDNTITRAEFSKILFESLKKDTVEGNAFEDTSDHWAKNQINTLVQDGIIEKSEYGASYNPNLNITRIEMAKMIVRALGHNDVASSQINATTKFVDNYHINGQNRGYVLFATENSIINGYPDETFKPNRTATRAEASKIIINMFDAENNGLKTSYDVSYDNAVSKVWKTDINDLKEYSFEELNYNFKDELKTPIFKDVGNIIKVDTSMFPLKFGNFVITNIEKLPYEKMPFYGAEKYDYLWTGWNYSGIVIEGIALKDNDSEGVIKGFFSEGSRLAILNKNGEILNNSQHLLFDDYVGNKMIEKYPSFRTGDGPIVPIGEEFTVLFTDIDEIGGKNLNNVDKIFITDPYFSTNNVLEIDFSQIKEGR